MSGIVGHTMYAVLAAKAAAGRRLPVAGLMHRHLASYLAGAYLGCDIQTMPQAVRIDTGKEVGFGTVPVAEGPLTGKLRPFALVYQGKSYTPRDVHKMFYGRAHLTFGWSATDRELTLPWDHLPDYCAAVVEDAQAFYGPGERPLAYVFGWMTHLVGDGLIKSVWPGVTLHLLDGKYTARNRPIQDLVTFHEIGRKELQLNWRELLTDLAETPVEPVQLHYMRVASPRGRLCRDFPEGWLPAQEDLLRAVLAENRRYLRVYKDHVLQEMELQPIDNGWECSAELRKATGGLSYAQMVEAAAKADFRHALWQIGEAIADLFGQVVQIVGDLRRLPGDDGPAWAELSRRWRKTPARAADHKTHTVRAGAWVRRIEYGLYRRNQQVQPHLFSVPGGPVGFDGRAFGREASKTKAQGVADAINRLLQTLVFRCARRATTFSTATRSGDRLRRATSAWVSSAWAGERAATGQPDRRPPLRVETRVKRGRGRRPADWSSREVRFPVWFDADGQGQDAHVRGVAGGAGGPQSFVGQHPSCFPPIVINITDGVATDGHPETDGRMRSATWPPGRQRAAVQRPYLRAGRAADPLFPASDASCPTTTPGCCSACRASCRRRCSGKPQILEAGVRKGRGFRVQCGLPGLGHHVPGCGGPGSTLWRAMTDE